MAVRVALGRGRCRQPQELPLEEAKHWPGYSKLGEASTRLGSNVLWQGVPAGTTSDTAKRQLEEECAVAPRTAESILLGAVSLAPTKRPSAGEAAAWRSRCRGAAAAAEGAPTRPS